MLQPCFLREQSNDTLSALRLSVSDPFAIFLAKLVANTLFLLLTELLLLPVFAVMYNVVSLTDASLARPRVFPGKPRRFDYGHSLSPPSLRKPECVNSYCHCFCFLS